VIDLEDLFGDDSRAADRQDSQSTTRDVDHDPFVDWVLRPDCRGRLGWEPHDLPESVRWWARFDFDDLPVPDTYRSTKGKSDGTKP
jgi:hypothetical protein